MRSRLPDRRVQVSERFAHGAQVWDAGFGFDRQGRVRELFLRPGGQGEIPGGSDLEALCDDLGRMTSFMLQQDGVGVGELAGRMGSAPRLGAEGREPASALGRALALAAAIEAEEGPRVRAAHASLGSFDTPAVAAGCSG